MESGRTGEPRERATDEHTNNETKTNQQTNKQIDVSKERVNERRNEQTVRYRSQFLFLLESCRNPTITTTIDLEVIF